LFPPGAQRRGIAEELGQFDAARALSARSRSWHAMTATEAFAPIGFARHCERSEAIHSFFVRRHGLLRFARNDDETRFRIPAACFARG
jgi:hypothetical protein